MSGARRKVKLEDTFDFKFNTFQYSDGAPVTIGGTAACSVYEESNLTQITAGVTVTEDYDGVTGLHNVSIVATSANGYERGKVYDVVISTGTVGGTSAVGTIIQSFEIMTMEEESVAELSKLHGVGYATTASTGNTTTAINLTGVVDANTAADDLNGEILLIKDLTDDTFHFVRVVDFAVTNLLATIEDLFGNALGFTPATGDYVWRVGTYPATDETGAAIATSSLQQTMDGKIDTADTVVDAIKAKTDSLTFTVSGNVDANTQYINDAEVVGDGNATPWDGA